jgi:hypothetical protein
MERDSGWSLHFNNTATTNGSGASPHHHRHHSTGMNTTTTSPFSAINDVDHKVDDAIESFLQTLSQIGPEITCGS